MGWLVGCGGGGATPQCVGGGGGGGGAKALQGLAGRVNVDVKMLGLQQKHTTET